MKRRVSDSCKMADSDISVVSTSERIEEPIDIIGSSTRECDFLPNKDSERSILEPNKLSTGSSLETVSKSGSLFKKSKIQKCDESKKKARNSQSSQLSLRSFFQKSTNLDNGIKDSCIGFSDSQAEPSQPNSQSLENSAVFDHSSSPVQDEASAACDQDLAELNDSSRKEEKSNVASQEWQRIQKMMQNSIPLCKGHKEPCIARVVKKQGANFGRRFYVCARAEVICFCQVALYVVLLSLKIILLHRAEVICFFLQLRRVAQFISEFYVFTIFFVFGLLLSTISTKYFVLSFKSCKVR